MPSNRGHGRQHPRWYKLCFSDNSADSSDDSDTDPVFRVHSSAPSVSIEESSHQVPSEPDSDSDSDDENDSHFSPSSRQRLPAYPLPLPPPPPPPPLVFSPPQSRPPSYPLPLPPPPIYPPPPPPSFDIQSLWAAYEALSSPSSYASRSLVDQLWPVTETGRIPQLPDEVVRTIRFMDIAGACLRDELSHCPICMEDFEVGDTVCMLPCNHAYRLVCILRWLETSRTCPVCRLELGKGCDRRAVEDHSEIGPPSALPFGTLRYFDYFPELERQEISGARDHNSEEAEHYDSARDEIDDDGDEGGASQSGGARG